jgi:hypothetical protein
MPNIGHAGQYAEYDSDDDAPTTPVAPFHGHVLGNTQLNGSPTTMLGLLGNLVNAPAPAAAAADQGNAQQTAADRERERERERSARKRWMQKRGYFLVSISASSLIEVCKRAKGLKSLNLASSAITADTYVVETREYVSQIQQQPEPYLTRVPVPVSDVFRTLVENCPYIEAINLSNTEFVDDALVEMIVNGLQMLEYLDLTGCTRLQAASAVLWELEGPAPRLEDVEEPGPADGGEGEGESSERPKQRRRSPLAGRILPTLRPAPANK